MLNDERQHLYDQIDKRVDQMMEMGLYQEVERLRDMGCTRDMVSMQGLGYKELFDFFDGKTDLPEAIRRIQSNTRRYMRKQETWFKKDKDIVWFSPTDIKEIIKYIDKSVKFVRK